MFNVYHETLLPAQRCVWDFNACLYNVFEGTCFELVSLQASPGTISEVFVVPGSRCVLRVVTFLPKANKFKLPRAL